MAYIKGHMCNKCKYFYEEWKTIYNPYHNGNPGSTDYEDKILYCLKNNKTGIQLDFKKYNCKEFETK